jgi:hypothetical protein
MKASILITTFKRPNLLFWGLHSIAKQECKHKFEVIVLNDGLLDETEEICNSYKDLLDIKCIFTGERNLDGEDHWRVPGFAFNIGAKIAQGEILFLSCAEMFHMGNSIEEMIDILEQDPNSRVICNGKDDVNGGFLKIVNETAGNPTIEDLNKHCGFLNSHLPFFMCFYKNKFMEIGGYDEDFTGLAWEDNDFIYRLNDCGVKQLNGHTYVVHLWHPRFSEGANPEIAKAMAFNQNIFNSKRRQVKRNIGREWGRFEPYNEWKLNKIPKTCHFYWGNEDLSFLRYLSVYTFRKFNPDWKIKIHKSINGNKITPTWRSNEQKNISSSGVNYIEKLNNLNVEIIEHDMSKYGFKNEYHEVHKSDFLRWILLSTEGGVWSDFDIVYTKSINKLKENNINNKDKDTFLCKYNDTPHHAIGFLMSSENNILFKRVKEIASSVFSKRDYQSIGALIFNNHYQTIPQINETGANGEFLDSRCVYSLDSNNILKFYHDDIREFDEESIGFHWYAGHPESQKWDHLLEENNYISNCTISNIIQEALNV